MVWSVTLLENEPKIGLLTVPDPVSTCYHPLEKPCGKGFEAALPPMESVFEVGRYAVLQREVHRHGKQEHLIIEVSIAYAAQTILIREF